MTRTTRVLSLLALVVGALAWSVQADAAGTNIDRTYGVDGVASYEVDGLDAVQRGGMGFQSDGSLVVLLGAHGLQRMSSAGALDTAFAGNAKVDGFLGVLLAIDSQNRILTLEASQGGDGTLRVRRFLADGHPDTAFGTGGSQHVPDAALSSFGRIAVDAQGRALVLYSRFTSFPLAEECAVLRFLATGAPDTSFGTNGVVLTGIVKFPGSGQGPQCDNLLVRPDGGFFASADTGMRRFDAAGQPVAFGSAASSPTGFGPGAVLRPDGSITWATSSNESNAEVLGIRVLTPAGEPDTSFSGDGELTISFAGLRPGWSSGGPLLRATWLGVRPDASLIVAGAPADNGASQARVLPNGTLDTSYGDAGRLVVFANELPGERVFSGLGGLAPDGVPHWFVQENGAWAFTRGVTRISGTGSSTTLTATTDTTSGPPGTLVTVTGSGCPGTEVIVGEPSDFGASIVDRRSSTGTSHYPTTADGAFTATFAVSPEASFGGTAPDHTYPIPVLCPATGKSIVAGTFTYTAATSTWMTVPLRPLHAGDTTHVVAVSPDGVAVGSSGGVPVKWDRAGNPAELFRDAGCTGTATAVWGQDIVGNVHCPGGVTWAVRWNYGFSGGTGPLSNAFEVRDTNPQRYVAGHRITAGTQHAIIAAPDGTTFPLLDAGLASSAAALTDYGYTVGTARGLDLIAPGYPAKIALGWLAGAVFPLAGVTVPSEAIDVNEGGYALVQLSAAGDERAILVGPRGVVVELSSAGLSDRATGLNEWSAVVGRRQLTATTATGYLYLGAQAVRVDSFVSSADRAVRTYDSPTDINDAGWIVGDSANDTSWLIRPSGT